MTKKTYTHKKAYLASSEYFNGDYFAADVFLKKYALRDENGDFLEKTPEDMHKRLAKEFARIEKKYPNSLSYDEIFSLLDKFKWIVPQGSPMAGIGNEHQIQSLSNCFVIEAPYDSYAGIMKADEEEAQIMKRRGGVGFDISTIRPSGLPTSNAARTTGGIGLFMERFSNTCREVAQGGRRGALMLTCDIRHPEVEKFITIKNERNEHGERHKVTGANVSLKITDEFMNAVVNDENFTLRWPIESSTPALTKEIRAKELWDKIITLAWESAEPGVLFWDTVTSKTPADAYAEDGYASVSTNPCSEIVLCPYDSCRLLLVNLFSFVKNPYKNNATFDWELFTSVAQKAQRLMDDIIDLEIETIDRILQKIENDPEPMEIKQGEKVLWQKIKDRAEQGRRTGTGITGLGDCLAALNITYGTRESIKLTEEVYKNFTLNCYRASVDLAAERGSFPVFSYEKEKEHQFIKQVMELDPELEKKFKKHGRRNIALTTTAPAGSVSIMTQTTSGIEPAYLLEYTRRRKINPDDENVKVDFVDQNGDSWCEYDIKHHGATLWQQATGKTDLSKSPYFNSTTDRIDWLSSVEVQAAAQKWVCHSISKTCNFPENTSKNVVAEAYMRAWQSGCKGFTVYREGCRTGVLVRKDTTSTRNEKKLTDHHAPKRPEILDCNIHHATINGEAWTILIGLMNDRPYEIFGGLSSTIELPRKYKQGKVTKYPKKSKCSIYNLLIGEGDNEFKIKDIINVFDNPTYGAFTRTISLVLRHGAPIQYVHEQLLKDKKDSDMFSFSRVVARVLKNYIPDGTGTTLEKACPDCESPNLAYQQGCVACVKCGWSACN